MKRSRTLYVVRTALLLLCITLVVFMAVFGVKVKIGWLGIDIDQKGFVEKDSVALGLDLAGGTSVVFEVIPKPGTEITSEGLEDTVNILTKRVNNPEASIYSISDTEIQLDIPGYDNPDEVIDRYGKSGELNFRDSSGNIKMTSTAIKEAYASINPETNEPVVSLVLTSEGKKQFKKVTGEIAASSDKTLSIYVGDELISSPSVKEAIDGEMGVIIQSESFVSDPTECEDLASYINAGVMEYELKCDEDHGSKSVVSASLGEEALSTSVTAALIGLILVMIFMIIIYRIPGVIASISLAAYTGIVILCIIGFDVTLTLPGIAGIILSIGMAVDANVIIFERIKEEIRDGRAVKPATESGFKRALSAIIDSNVTTAIAAAVLIFVGEGMVKGFGITLLIGVVISVLTAYFLSKTLLRLFTGMGILKPSLYCPNVKGGNE
ncbi:MAG: protein translocase subunit SecD [Clostridia bacterium]|nr:protein translocase subunit SecD [Clostridia bacterium]